METAARGDPHSSTAVPCCSPGIILLPIKMRLRAGLPPDQGTFKQDAPVREPWLIVWCKKLQIRLRSHQRAQRRCNGDSRRSPQSSLQIPKKRTRQLQIRCLKPFREAVIDGCNIPDGPDPASLLRHRGGPRQLPILAPRRAPTANAQSRSPPSSNL
jgi:hypothetical protein